MYKYYWVPSDPCAVLQSSSWFVCLSSCTNTTECHLTLVQYCTSSWFVCLSSCTNTTECHLTLVQYCSLAPGLCVWVHVQILLSAIWPLCSTAVCSLAPGLCVWVHVQILLPSDPCTVLVCVWVHVQIMYKYYWLLSAVHLTLVQYCSLAPGLCVSSWPIWPLCSTAV